MRLLPNSRVTSPCNTAVTIKLSNEFGRAMKASRFLRMLWVKIKFSSYKISLYQDAETVLNLTHWHKENKSFSGISHGPMKEKIWYCSNHFTPVTSLSVRPHYFKFITWQLARCQNDSSCHSPKLLYTTGDNNSMMISKLELDKHTYGWWCCQDRISTSSNTWHLTLSELPILCLENLQYYTGSSILLWLSTKTPYQQKKDCFQQDGINRDDRSSRIRHLTDQFNQCCIWSVLRMASLD